MNYQLQAKKSKIKLLLLIQIKKRRKGSIGYLSFTMANQTVNFLTHWGWDQIFII
jgi:hypothetical protein